MMKIIFPRVVAALFGVATLTALTASADSSTASSTPAPGVVATQVTPATTAPAKSSQKIGAAPSGSNQSKILAGALSAKTRQALQTAMDSLADDGSAHR